MDAKSSPTSTIFRSQSPSSSPLPPPPSVQAGLVVSPCAACKTLRRRCTEKCVLAPYFPPSDPLKFTIAHRIFGASNIIKLLQVPHQPLISYFFSSFRVITLFLVVEIVNFDVEIEICSWNRYEIVELPNDFREGKKYC